MIKYVVTQEGSIVEFQEEALALAYASEHGGTVSQIEQNETIEVLLPDVTPRQIRQALILSGISLAAIDAALDALPEPTKSLARTEWEYSISFQRSRPLVAQVGQMLGWTSAQLDALWQLAGTL